MIGMGGESKIRTGVRLADTSRECLFFLVEKFFHPKVICPQPARTCQRIGDTLSYLRRNFEREEALMRLCGYPYLQRHKAEHDQLIKDLEYLHKTLTCSGYDNQKIKVLVTDWSLRHAKDHDRRFGEFLKANPVPTTA